MISVAEFEAWVEPRVTPEPMSGCWLWLGAIDGSGYPQIRINHRRFGVHRMALGLVDPRTQACHRCDNRSCVNPVHLFAGSNGDNVRDCVAKGRHAKTRLTHCKHGHPFDVANTRLRNGRHRVCRACVRRRSADYQSSIAKAGVE